MQLHRQTQFSTAHDIIHGLCHTSQSFMKLQKDSAGLYWGTMSSPKVIRFSLALLVCKQTSYVACEPCEPKQRQSHLRGGLFDDEARANFDSDYQLFKNESTQTPTKTDITPSPTDNLDGEFTFSQLKPQLRLTQLRLPLTI